MIRQALGALAKIGLAFVAGIIVSGLLLMALGLARQALAQEATPTYEAEPGQINRGFNYRPAARVVTEVESVNDPIYDPGYTEAYACQRNNEKLMAMLQMIVQEIIKDPVNGHFYEGAITTIHSMWCAS